MSSSPTPSHSPTVYRGTYFPSLLDVLLAAVAIEEELAKATTCRPAEIDLVLLASTASVLPRAPERSAAMNGSSEHSIRTTPRSICRGAVVSWGTSSQTIS